MSIALVATSDLYEVARYIRDNDDADFAARCRALLITSVGIVEFPKIPISCPQIGGETFSNEVQPPLGA